MRRLITGSMVTATTLLIGGAEVSAGVVPGLGGMVGFVSSLLGSLLGGDLLGGL